MSGMITGIFLIIIPTLMLTLVGVFLRVLEYYRGITFLTTSQIAQFDVAVQSRVLIALKNDKLDEEQTFKIFMGFVN